MKGALARPLQDKGICLGTENFNKVYSVQFSSLVMALEAASHKAGLASNNYELRRTLESFSKRERMTSWLL